VSQGFSPNDGTEVIEVEHDPDGVHTHLSCIDDSGEIVEEHSYANPHAVDDGELEIPEVGEEVTYRSSADTTYTERVIGVDEKADPPVITVANGDGVPADALYRNHGLETDGGRKSIAKNRSSVGLPDTFEDLASSEVRCVECGDAVDERWIYSGRCPGCRHGGGRGASARQHFTDGGPYAVGGERDTTDQEDALAHLQEIVEHMTAVDWRDVPEIGVQEAAALTTRLEDARRQLEESR
jgi:hypothetical protein